MMRIKKRKSEEDIITIDEDEKEQNTTSLSLDTKSTPSLLLASRITDYFTLHPPSLDSLDQLLTPSFKKVFEEYCQNCSSWSILLDDIISKCLVSFVGGHIGKRLNHHWRKNWPKCNDIKLYTHPHLRDAKKINRTFIENNMNRIQQAGHWIIPSSMVQEKCTTLLNEFEKYQIENKQVKPLNVNTLSIYSHILDLTLLQIIDLEHLLIFPLKYSSVMDQDYTSLFPSVIPSLTSFVLIARDRVSKKIKEDILYYLEEMITNITKVNLLRQVIIGEWIRVTGGTINELLTALPSLVDLRFFKSDGPLITKRFEHSGNPLYVGGRIIKMTVYEFHSIYITERSTYEVTEYIKRTNTIEEHFYEYAKVESFYLRNKKEVTKQEKKESQVLLFTDSATNSQEWDFKTICEKLGVGL